MDGEVALFLRTEFGVFEEELFAAIIVEIHDGLKFGIFSGDFEDFTCPETVVLYALADAEISHGRRHEGGFVIARGRRSRGNGPAGRGRRPGPRDKPRAVKKQKAPEKSRGPEKSRRP